MEFYEELLLSLISILLALLIGKIASTAGDLDRGRAKTIDRSVEDTSSGEIEKIGGGSVDVIGSDAIGSNEVEIEGEFKEDEGIAGQEHEKSMKSELEKSEEAGAYEFVLGKGENREEKISEVVEIESEENSAKESVGTVELGKKEAVLAQIEERVEGVRSIQGEEHESEIGRGEEGGIDEKEGTLLCGEEEWEGIEKSELEKLFGVAVEYVGSPIGGNAMSKLSSDVQRQLYGLHKVATEGPCYEPQPLALKVSARAKWHSWQRLGNMSPEVAMDQYITLLSKSIAGWMGEKPGVSTTCGEAKVTLDVGVPGAEKLDSSSFFHVQTGCDTHRVCEDPPYTEVSSAANDPKLSTQGLTKTFLFDLLSPTRVTFLSLYL